MATTMLTTPTSLAIARLIDREGGYIDHPADPGGETKWGISRRFLIRVGLPNEDIRGMSRERAAELYDEYFVKPNRLDGFKDERLAELVLDWVVNGGPAVKSLQRLLSVDVDGVVGDETLKAANALSPKQIEALCASYLRDRMFYFASLTKHPFIKGWLARLVKLGL
jgi:lysozyme family protein